MKYLILILVTSCSLFQDRDNEPKNPISEKLELVKEKRDLYCELSRKRVEENGYAVSKCDGLLFTSLHSIGCGYPSLSDFEDNGRWYRSPTKDCLENEESASTISKDMIRGMTLYHYAKDSKEPLERFETFCEENMSKGGVSCKIGDAKDTITALSRTEFPITSLIEIQDFLGQKKLTSVGQQVQPDFKGHLDVLGVIAKGIVYGGIRDSELQRLEAYAKKEPKNALYQATFSSFSDGDQERAINILLNETLFPADRLPSNKEYCTHYLFQRDEAGNSDWLPCDREGVHDGTDFIFAASVVLGDLIK